MRSVYQSEPQETVLFHGPNRIGLGHLNRLSAIALALKKKSPHVRPLFAVEGGAHVILEAVRLPFVPLPSEYLMYETGHWEDWNKGRRTSLALDMCRSLLAATDPAIVVIDCYPSLALGTAILEKGTPIVLCLRAMKDVETHLSRLRRILPAVELIILPHDPGAMTLPKEFEDKACFVGQIVRPGLSGAGELPAKKRPLIVISGGGGGYPETVDFYNFAAQAVSDLKTQYADCECRLITGPLFEDWLALRPAPGVSVIPYDPDVRNTFAGADLVICQAGYNTVAELECIGTKTILVPAPRALDDQFARARQVALTNRRFRSYEGNSPAELARVALSLLNAEVIGAPQELPQGAERAAEKLAGILQSRSVASFA